MLSDLESSPTLSGANGRSTFHASLHLFLECFWYVNSSRLEESSLAHTFRLQASSIMVPFAESTSFAASASAGTSPSTRQLPLNFSRRTADTWFSYLECGNRSEWLWRPPSPMVPLRSIDATWVFPPAMPSAPARHAALWPAIWVGDTR